MIANILEMRKEEKQKAREKRERYTQLNAEFQRRARRAQKVFFSVQCKEIEDNNRRGKTRDVFKKIGYIKGTFHARLDMIKDRNGKDLTEAEEIEKKQQEYTEKLFKKVLMTQITTMLWSLTQSQTSWSVKSNGPLEVMEFQLSYFKS